MLTLRKKSSYELSKSAYHIKKKLQQVYIPQLIWHSAQNNMISKKMRRLGDKPGTRNRLEHLELKTHSFKSKIQEFDLNKATYKRKFVFTKIKSYLSQFKIIFYSRL